MLVAITSDIHNNLVNLRKVLDYCKAKEIKTLICCGDLASLETLDFLNDNFSGNILLTFGNAEYDEVRNLYDQKKYKNIHLFPQFGEAIIEKKKVAFVHYPDKAKGLARTGKYDLIFHGHTHKPWIISAKADENGRPYTILNPGNVAGEIYPPTFAVWNISNEKFDLIRVHGLE